MNKKCMTYFSLLMCLLLAGCISQERKKLNYIKHVQGDLAMDNYYNHIQATSDTVINKIGNPDLVMTYNEFIDFIKGNKQILDEGKESVLGHLNFYLKEAKEKHKFTDTNSLEVWIYMPNHKQPVQIWRFLLPPITCEYYSRPFFIIGDGKFVLASHYPEDVLLVKKASKRK